MKIQSLAVISIILILPMSIILGSYIGNEVKTLNYQISYDSKLQNATYDALKAFQINSSNSDTSDLSNSRIRDIKAGANTFFNSLATNFNMPGYNKDILKNYVPAVVFTMYDGYYIYAPYTNTLTNEESNMYQNATSHTNGEEVTDLKPYVYYSCRYKKDDLDLDVVITYALDNHITVQGRKGTENIYLSGYLLTDVSYNNKTANYRGVTIEKEYKIKECLYKDGSRNIYTVREFNGVKNYIDESKGVNELGRYFTMLNGEMKNGTSDDSKINDNYNGVEYYKEAFELKKELGRLGIDKLKVSNAVDSKGDKIWPDNNKEIFYGLEIRYTSDTSTAIESVNSNFNQHRAEVIRYCIEKNLSVAISNFNTHSTSTTDFQMPKLKETDWDLLQNEISIISFLQGLSIGGKLYSGYSVVPNSYNKEVISEDSIYIVKNRTTAYKITDKYLQGNINEIDGVADKNLRRSSTEDAQGRMQYFFRYPADIINANSEKIVSFAYGSAVTSSNVISLENYKNDIYTYVDTLRPNVKKVYYTALGRERRGMYRSDNRVKEAMGTKVDIN